MRAFDDLTRQGQNGRLRTLALEALRDYDLEIARCSFVARAFNTVFRVDTADGSSYALRMSPSLRIHADGCEEAEAAWVAALRRDAGLPSPLVIPTRDGSVVARAAADGVPDERSCVLFEWVRGHRLRDRLRADLVSKVGVLAARVHEHAAGYLSEAPRGVFVGDRVCYFRVPDRLEELRPTYGSVLDDALVRAQEALDDLWRNPPHPARLLHGDMQSANVMVNRGAVVIIDFQDLVWGFDAQDVAIALVALDAHGDPGSWSAAFRSGYESVRPWPDAAPATWAALRAARHLNILNFGLTVARPDLDTFFTRHADPVIEWMAG